MSYYSLYLENEATEHQTQGSSPRRALVEMVEAAGLTLARQDGRYGTLTDGRHVSAMTQQWTRAQYEDARTTRTHFADRAGR